MIYFGGHQSHLNNQFFFRNTRIFSRFRNWVTAQMFLIKVVYAMLCVCVFSCPSSFIVGSPSYLLSILIQKWNSSQLKNSTPSNLFWCRIHSSPFFFTLFYKNVFLRRPTINDSIYHQKYSLWNVKVVTFVRKLWVFNSKFVFSARN